MAPERIPREPIDLDERDAIVTFVEYIVDSFEPLEIVVYLFRIAPRAIDARVLGRMLSLPPEVVAGVLRKLEHAGIVRVRKGHDDAGWALDPGTPWESTIELLVELYDLDRAQLLAFIQQVVFESCLPGRRRASMFAFLVRPDRKRLPS